MSFGLPPFTRGIKLLVLANAAVFLVMLLLRGFAPRLAAAIMFAGQLMPVQVIHGWLWQLVTYSFLHGGLWHILFNMLGLWMFGYMVEQYWGKRQFLEFYFFSVVGAALTTIAVSYLGLWEPFHFLGINPAVPTIGSSGGVFGVMIATAILFGDTEFMLFPFPFRIKAKYLVGIYVFVALAGALGISRGESVANFAHLGGALFGYLYLKFVPRRGLGFATSESFYGFRNAWYRFKRRRAAKKFEVYMRKHGDRPYARDEFDPESKSGKGPRKGPWVN